MSRPRPGRRVRLARRSRRLSAERGLTIVEVMVAAMILVLGAIAIFKIVDAATRTSYRAEQSQVVSNLLQRELEKVKAMSPADMALNANSNPSPDSCLANRIVAAQAGPAISPIMGDDLITSNEGTLLCQQDVSASPGGDDASDVTITIYRFVTWYDPDLGEDCEHPNPDDEDADEVCGMRRITIGAKPTETGPGGERTYKEIQSDVVDVTE